ncbi:hypothetical protein Tco_0678958 [Tanacetum coccineum]|uniref:Uncharacterized protein n=1 Tax=Tanacetum coccineum TaxID=301880 RepID=A0ABQ4XGQ6_9ASTR
MGRILATDPCAILSTEMDAAKLARYPMFQLHHEDILIRKSMDRFKDLLQKLFISGHRDFGSKSKFFMTMSIPVTRRTIITNQRGPEESQIIEADMEQSRYLGNTNSDSPQSDPVALITKKQMMGGDVLEIIQDNDETQNVGVTMKVKGNRWKEPAVEYFGHFTN